VIENRLLAALHDEEKAAILVSRDDLDLLTDALEYASLEMEGSDYFPVQFRRMFDDLQQLRKAAFGEPENCGNR
jgi:hypothetical protein